MIDERAIARAQELHRSNPDLEDVAFTMFRDGFDRESIQKALAATRTLPFMAPLGFPIFMPALVLGHEVTGLSPGTGLSGIDAGPRWGELHQAEDLPPGLIHINQQAGGYFMRYPQLFGYLFPLEENAIFARTDPRRLIRGLRLMGESGESIEEAAFRKDYPLLARFHLTTGDLSRSQLKAFSNAVIPYLKLPAAVSGLEAFIRLNRCRPLDYIGGWKWYTVDDERAEERAHAEFPSGSVGGTVDENTLEELSAFARRYLDTTSPPDLFFLWENSD